MNIETISELNSLADTQSVIRSLSAAQAYVEISYPVTGGCYSSYKLPFNVLMQSICTELLQLSNAISDLNNQTTDIRGNFVHLSGDTMTGKLNINTPNSNALYIDGNSEFLGNAKIIAKDNNSIHVQVKNGQLVCTGADIDGCALTAKWC